jgi:hypothetical protein
MIIFIIIHLEEQVVHNKNYGNYNIIYVKNNYI